MRQSWGMRPMSVPGEKLGPSTAERGVWAGPALARLNSDHQSYLSVLLVALEVPTIQDISNSQLLHGELVNMLCLEIKAPQTSLKTHLNPITTNPFTVKYRRYWPSSSSLKHNRHFSVFYSLPCAHHEIHLWFSRVQELQRLGAALVPCPLPVFFHICTLQERGNA